MNREQAKKAIFDTKGKIFNVKFIKKDGTLRSMTCRRGVSKDVKGVGMSYDPQKFNLIGVYDMQKGYRMINASTIQEVTINGKTHEVAE